MGGRATDISGLRFGRLSVIGRTDNVDKRRAWWSCHCDCGRIVDVRGYCLKNGGTKSCGCLQTETWASTHHKTKSAEYQTWSHMRRRCLNPLDVDYPRWGGRGIRICERWNDFPTFLTDMGQRPSPEHSIDRIDNDGNYEPSNCRWSLKLEQANNTRQNVHMTYRGKRMTLRQAMGAAGNIVGRGTAYTRIYRWGWSVERAVETPAMW